MIKPEKIDTTETKNEKLARLCGQEMCVEAFRHVCEGMGACDGCRQIIAHITADHSGRPCIRPDYENSLDAQEAPGGPAELAQERGWHLNVAYEFWVPTTKFEVTLRREGTLVTGRGPTLASAFCEAYVKALEAGA